MSKVKEFESRALAGAIAAGLLLSVVAIPAAAQDVTTEAPATASTDAPATASAADEVEEVVVTGSRIQRAGFEAPTPTTVLSADTLAKLATTDIGSTLGQLPAFQTDQNGSTNTLGGDAGRRYANLRGLGSQRTLVLMDGQRLPPSALTGQTDLNTIPQILINRVDIVTGGASAQWGSDAVAGVVNLMTKKSIDGFETDFSYGASQQNDNIEKRFGLAYGNTFADGRARLVLGGEWADNQGVGDMYTRDWGREEWGLVRNASYAPNTGQAQFLVLPNVRRSVVGAGGLVIGGPLNGVTFNPDGSPRYFNFGDINGGTGGTMSGGEGYAKGDAQGTMLLPATERASAQARLSYDLTSDIELFGQANINYVNVNGTGPGPLDYASNSLLIKSDNAYLSPAMRDMMVANGVNSFQIGRYWKDDLFGSDFALSRPSLENTARAHTFTLGANGNFAGDWTWDSYASYSRNTVDADQRGYRIQSRYYESADAVLDANGVVVCRSALTNPGNGCVPVNLFGEGSVTPEAAAYFTGSPSTELTYERTVFAANLNGVPFSTWAGEVAVAAGVEHRRDEVDLVQNDPLALARAYNYGNTQPISGSVDVTEGYVETVVPLLSDVPLAQKLELTGAVRLTNYSTSGSVTTWKLGMTDVVTDSLRLRASISRDIRAPNVSELYTGQSTGIANIFHPITNDLYATTTVTSGNEDLDPERSTTVTGGFAFQPAFLPGFRLSADIYNIEIKDVISSISANNVFQNCFLGGQQNFCDLLSFQGPATATAQLPMQNLSSLEVRGVDGEVSYGFDLSSLVTDAMGRLDFNLFLTYQSDIIVAGVNRAGDMGASARPYGGPEWKWNLLTTYSLDRFKGTVGLRYVGEGIKDATVAHDYYSDPNVDSVIYTSLALSYDVPVSGKLNGLQVYSNVQNLFDVDPPVNPVSGAGNPYNSIFHDVIGRTYTVGLRAQF